MRHQLTEKIVRIKIERGLHWADIAKLAPGLSKEYVTAALLGQMKLPEAASLAIGHHLGLSEFEIKLLQEAALSRVAADRGADRPADLPILRADPGVRQQRSRR